MSGNEIQPVLEACAVEALSLRPLSLATAWRGTCGFRLFCRFVAHALPSAASLAKRCPISRSLKASAIRRIIFAPRSSPSPEGQPLELRLASKAISSFFAHQLTREPGGILMMTVQTPLMRSATAVNRC
jgi:hypothetical protein